ncbi:MAG TPA: hypothetical protein VFR23_00905 [Jiangellaceae bacterium]|nr:hypothetical protein [Jiangellaceae bacterium]
MSPDLVEDLFLRRAHQVRPRTRRRENLIAVPAQHHPRGHQHIVDQPTLHRNAGRGGDVGCVADRAQH